LWVGTIGFPAFGGLFLAAPLVGTPVDGSWWGTLGAELLFGGIFSFAGVLLGVPRLAELARRGAWVPPGTARHPVRVAIALAVLSMAAAVAAMLTLILVVRLANPAS
jgi:hypothetical protein